LGEKEHDNPESVTESHHQMLWSLLGRYDLVLLHRNFWKIYISRNISDSLRYFADFHVSAKRLSLIQ